MGVCAVSLFRGVHSRDRVCMCVFFVCFLCVLCLLCLCVCVCVFRSEGDMSSMMAGFQTNGKLNYGGFVRMVAQVGSN